MQLLTPITLMLLAGSTLAMPTTNDTSIHEKRGHHGWVGSGFTDLNCNGQPVGDTQKYTTLIVSSSNQAPMAPTNFLLYYGTSVYRFRLLASQFDCWECADCLCIAVGLLLTLHAFCVILVLSRTLHMRGIGLPLQAPMSQLNCNLEFIPVSVLYDRP